MGNNYRVKVRAEIEEYADTTTDGPRKEGIGTFEWVVSTKQAHSIKASALINRVRHQEDATPSRTLRENTESEG